MNLPLFIAGRYLFAGKSHNVINIISAISAVGLTVGAAALIIILSVYNGFDGLIKSMMTSVEPDLMVVPDRGKFFTPDDEAFTWAYDNPDIATISSVLQDNVFASYEGRQSTILLKGVDSVYAEDGSPILDCITDGGWMLRLGERPYAAVGAGLAVSMGINRHFISPIELFYPERGAKVSAANPMGSINIVKVWPSCEFAVSNDVDSRLMIVDRALMCELTGCEDEVSAVEIRLKEGTAPKTLQNLKAELRRRLGPDYRVLDRSEQNPALYKMLRYEKASVYLIMFLVVLILGFSIFGSLRMLIIEKQSDIAIFRAMGATHATVKWIFVLEGWLISLVGMVTGVTIGVAVVLLQQHFGFVPMPGNFIVDAYPVVLNWADVAFSAAGIALSGLAISYLAARKLSTARQSS